MCSIKCSVVCYHRHAEYIREFFTINPTRLLFLLCFRQKEWFFLPAVAILPLTSMLRKPRWPSGLSGFRKDAAMKNSFNPARDFSLCCKRGHGDIGSTGREMLCSSTAPAQTLLRPPCNKEEEEEHPCPSQGRQRPLSTSKTAFWKISKSSRSLQSLQLLFQKCAEQNKCISRLSFE